MITELHFYFGLCVLAGVILCTAVAQGLAGLAYPGSSASLIPEGPARTILVADLGYLALSGVLYLFG